MTEFFFSYGMLDFISALVLVLCSGVLCSTSGTSLMSYAEGSKYSRTDLFHYYNAANGGLSSKRSSFVEPCSTEEDREVFRSITSDIWCSYVPLPKKFTNEIEALMCYSLLSFLKGSTCIWVVLHIAYVYPTSPVPFSVSAIVVIIISIMEIAYSFAIGGTLVGIVPVITGKLILRNRAEDQ